MLFCYELQVIESCRGFGLGRKVSSSYIYTYFTLSFLYNIHNILYNVHMCICVYVYMSGNGHPSRYIRALSPVEDNVNML